MSYFDDNEDHIVNRGYPIRSGLRGGGKNIRPRYDPRYYVKTYVASEPSADDFENLDK